MSYTDKLFSTVDKFFMEVVMPYGKTYYDATSYLKKFKPFSKKNYDSFISGFEKHMDDAGKINMDDIQIPPDDELSNQLKNDFEKSKKSFMTLCKRNMNFFDFENRRARKEKVSADELKDLFLGVNAAKNSAGRDVENLEEAYKELKASLDPEFSKAWEQEKAQIKERLEQEKKKQDSKLKKKANI